MTGMTPMTTYEVTLAWRDNDTGELEPERTVRQLAWSEDEAVEMVRGSDQDRRRRGWAGRTLALRTSRARASRGGGLWKEVQPNPDYDSRTDHPERYTEVPV